MTSNERRRTNESLFTEARGGISMKTSRRREQVSNVFPPGSITQPRPQNVNPHEGEREEGGAFSVLSQRLYDGPRRPASASLEGLWSMSIGTYSCRIQDRANG